MRGYKCTESIFNVVTLTARLGAHSSTTTWRNCMMLNHCYGEGAIPSLLSSFPSPELSRIDFPVAL
jgi:hypothetical protein